MKTIDKRLRDSGHWVMILLLLYVLVCAVSLVGGGFKVATSANAKDLIYLADNPLLGLFVGILATSLIQSSSTVTSIVVGLVAGGLPVPVAVPLIMGANIGTSSTNTIVSFGHVRNYHEFKRAFAAATIHDLFNLLAVSILFPLEFFTHWLEKVSYAIANLFVGVESLSIKRFNLLKQATKPVTNFFKEVTSVLNHPLDGVVLVGIGVVLVFVSIYCMGILLKKLMKKNAKSIIKKTVGRNAFSSFLTGLGVTIAVQSSSTSTSLAIPFAGQDLVSLEELYPYTLGANIGTTVTALLASTAVLENQLAALTIAFVHLLFNCSGCILIYGVPFLRKLPYNGAKLLAEIAVNAKWKAVVYTLVVFFTIPGLMVMILK